MLLLFFVIPLREYINNNKRPLTPKSMPLREWQRVTTANRI